MVESGQVKEFIVDIVLGFKPEDLKDDDSFMDKGLIDSVGMLELISMIEVEYDITIEDDEMIPANLDSVNNVIEFVKRKQL